MSNNPLEASIHLSLHDDVSSGLAKIGAEILGLNGHVEKLQKGLKDVVSGAVKFSVAFGMAEFIKDLTQANGLLERQLNIFRMTGNSAADTEALRKAAYDAAVKVRGVGVVEQAKLARELSSALQDNPGARAVLPDFARAKAVIAFATGRDSDDDTTRLAKMIELRGGAINTKTDKIDPEMFRKELDAATKALVVGQGLLTSNDLQQMIKQGGPAMKNFRGNPEMFWSDYLAMAEDMGGARAGTATTAIARQVLGGIMTPSVKKEWQRLGLLSADGSGWGYDKKGNIVIDDPSKAIVGYKNFQHGGVEEFVDTTLKKAFAAHGITKPDDINAEMYRFGSTETARRAYGLYLSNDAQIKAVHDRYFKSMGVEGFDKVVSKDLLYNEQAVSTAFTGLKTALGDAAGVAPVLGSIADGINQLAKAASEHPNIGKAVTWGGGAAAAGLGTYGLIQMVRGLLEFRKGFGLPAAATELTVAAKLLDAAAGKLLLLGPKDAATATAERLMLPGPQSEVDRFLKNADAAKSKIKVPWLGIVGAGVNLGIAAADAPGVQYDDKGRPSLKPVFDVKPIDDVAVQIGAEIKSWPGKLKSAVATFGDEVVKEVSGAFTGLGGKIAKFLHLSSFAGSSAPGGLINASYTSGGGTALAQHALGAGVVNQGTINVYGGGNSGGSLIRASYGGLEQGSWRGGMMPVGSSTGIGHTASQQERAAFIRAYAAHIGIDPNTALRVAQSEGFYQFTGDHGTSFGDFQMHVGGGLGDRLRRMGVNPADPHNWMQSDKMALDIVRREGWSAWHGAAHVGIGNHQGIGHSDLRSYRENAPVASPPPQKHETVIHTKVHLDGKVVARNTMKHIVREAKMPHAISGQDDYGSWAAPGTTMMPA